MQIFGYVRVSTKNQNENRQLDELEKSGIKMDKIFIDKQSGKDFDRPNYKKMISILKPKDILVIKSIDRLGRSPPVLSSSDCGQAGLCRSPQQSRRCLADP